MPVLELEPFVYPEALFGLTEERPTGQWWVLHTKPRAEKSVARRLYARGVNFYLPLHERTQGNGKGRAAAHLPLFPGYLFLHGDPDARIIALETGHLAGCLPVVDQDRLWVDLQNVHRLLSGEIAANPETRLLPGQLVEIVAGPLAGMVGKWIRRGGSGRFLVEVEMLRQGVSVELDEWMVQAV